ncbi:MAG: helix-turn-helix domain-containing protein [Lachnospiraceae bacterium]|nr:helix-turn-helix domain-containing protein [Lachnospiraceae bacterium]
MKLLTVRETQAVLRIGRDKTYALMKSKAFPSIKIGGRYFVDEDALQEWVQKYSYREFVF